MTQIIDFTESVPVEMVKPLSPGTEIGVTKVDTVEPAKPAKKKALMLRVGGIGDILILTPIAKELSKRWYEVEYYIGSPSGPVYQLLEGLPYIKVREVSRINNIDCVKDEDGHFVSVEIMKSKFDEIFDFKFSVEDNKAGLNGNEGWRNTINSNYVNWIDLSFGWANIDPTMIADEDKRPEIYIPPEYHAWAQKVIPGCDLIVGIQLQSSSLMRTWYRADELPKMIHEKYPDSIVMFFTNNTWQFISKFGMSVIKFPPDMNALVCSAALIARTQFFICADSGAAHIAEALKIPNITIYTTVPSWTRMKYYKYTYAIDAIAPCRPCFTLHMFCPLEMKKARESLTEREKMIVDSAVGGEDIMAVARRLGTLPKALQLEFKASKEKVEGLSATMPECVKSVTPDMILDALHHLMKEI